MGRGLLSPPSVPLNPGIVTGHLLCAADEFPLVGEHSVVHVLNMTLVSNALISDFDLFGSKSVYREALENLLDRGAIEESQQITGMNTYVKHPVSLMSTMALIMAFSCGRPHFFLNLFSNSL